LRNLRVAVRHSIFFGAPIDVKFFKLIQMPLHDRLIRPAHSKVISACVSNNKYGKVNSAPQHNLDLVILDFLPLYFILRPHQYLLLHIHSYIHTPNIQKDLSQNTFVSKQNAPSLAPKHFFFHKTTPYKTNKGL
jgi:hypothetical protein